MCLVECDQVIFSAGESRGVVTSPYYPRPYPRDVRCIYYLDGLHDKQNLEKVQLTITDLDIPRHGRRYSTHSRSLHASSMQIAGLLAPENGQPGGGGSKKIVGTKGV